MERQNRLLTILAVVLLAIIAVIAIDNNQTGGKKKKDEDPDAPATHELVDYKPDDIVSLKVTNGQGPEVSFEKTGGKWTMVAPKSVPIDERKVSEIVDRFDPVLVEEHPLTGDPAGYGLDPASRSTLVFGTADSRVWTVYVGKDTTVGFGSYVQTADGGPVGVAQSHLADLGHRGVDDFRSKTLWTFSSGTARRIQIDRGDVRVVLRKDDHGWWLGDEGPRVDDKTVEDWLQKADMLRADSFMDDGPADMKPVATLTVEDADGTHVLQVGDTDGEGADARVAVKGDGPLAKTTGSVNDLVKLDGWQGVALMTVKKYQVDSIALVFGDYKATFTKVDGAWKDADGKPYKLGDGVLDQIDHTHADRSTVPAGAASGWGSITLTETDDGKPHSEAISIGDVAAGAALASRVAKDAGGGPAFSVLQADLDVILGVARATVPPPRPEAPPSGPPGMEGFEGIPGMSGGDGEPQ